MKCGRHSFPPNLTLMLSLSFGPYHLHHLQSPPPQFVCLVPYENVALQSSQVPKRSLPAHYSLPYCNKPSACHLPAACISQSIVVICFRPNYRPVYSVCTQPQKLAMKIATHPATRFWSAASPVKIVRTGLPVSVMSCPLK